MDCLDRPLHLQILSSLATSLARSSDEEEKQEEALKGSKTHSRLEAILSGLPLPATQDQGQDDADNDDEDEKWTEFEVNHAISYAHYVACLPSHSPLLPTALPRLKELLFGLLAQGAPGSASSSAPSSSSRPALYLESGTVQQCDLCETLLKALIWVSWSAETLESQVEDILVEFLGKVAEYTSASNSMTFSLVLLNSFHSVLANCPVPPLSTERLSLILTRLLNIASPSNLVKLLHRSSSQSSPENPSGHNPFVAPHPSTPGGVVILVSEIANVLLAGALLAADKPEHRPFAHTPPSSAHLAYDDFQGSVISHQMEQLIANPLALAADTKLFTNKDTSAADELAKSAVRWWNEVTRPARETDGDGAGEFERRDSLFTLGGGILDEEVEITVSLLHLFNILDLHRDEPTSSHLTRLRLLLSENNPAGDPRVLEAAFICTSVLVRNHPPLAIANTMQIRRLLMSPVSAFEGEMGFHGGDLPPAVKAASQCLSICIELSSNDDLVSSTLYSLLNTLSQGGALQTSATAIQLRSQPPDVRDGEVVTVRSDLSGPKKTVEQRTMIAVTAVQIVSRLALDMGRDDMIHLSIALLLQRLRGVDIVIEATIVTQLVPLALAGSKSDLVEVYRAFSQISRSSHPEDPRMESNAILAAQTKLAQGLGKRLDCAEGYLVDLLNLFADKGTQTQMISMAANGYDSRDLEKMHQLKQDSVGRVSDMRAWLGALLVPISALLSHVDFHPAKEASTEMTTLFRNLWFICVAFGLSGPAGKKRLSDHEWNALGVIAQKSPCLVLEGSSEYVDEDLEYSSILRKDFAAFIAGRQRTTLSEYLPNHKVSYDIRSLSAAQTTLLLAICDLEEARTIRYRPSVMLEYFRTDSPGTGHVISTLDAIAQKLSTTFLKQMSHEVVSHSLPLLVSEETCKILLACTNRYRKVREVARNYAKQIVETFSALLCDRQVVFTLLEILTLMRRSCEMQFTEEYTPTWEFKSDKMDLTLVLTDDYAVRNEITTQLHGMASHWLTLAISRAPLEVQSTLQTYLNESRDVLLIDNVEMGAGLALHYSKAISKLDRQETMMPNIGGWMSDSSNLVASQFAAKNYFHGELSGARHVLGQGLANLQKGSPAASSQAELQAFKSQMAEAVRNIKQKQPFSVPDIRRLLLRASSVLASSPTVDHDIIHYLVELPLVAFTPLAIAAGVDAWTWLLRQRPETEVAVIGEISAGWLQTIRLEKGLFSTSMNYQDPFETPIEYAPTDNKLMALEMIKAKRMLRPHLLLIQVLSSQFQAIKYRESGIMVSLIRLMMRSLGAAKRMSTHALAREVRFSFLLFGFQILASSQMEALLELRFRDRLYAAAFAWFSVRPQWSFGSDRIQVGAEIKLLQDFLAAVTEDHVRGDHSISSMPERVPPLLIQGSTSLHDYSMQHRDRLKILRLLVESEINRLHVWCNPVNESGRSPNTATGLEKTIGNDEWTRLISRAWRLSPSMAVHMGERFKQPAVQNEITRLVRQNPRSVIGVPEAMHYLLGDGLVQGNRNSLKWLPVWAPVPPITALAYFSPRYGNHPLILQYAMRVLEQYPVELTFFFVPQVVQGLRTDGLGYVERFIFETSKISQLFCHQIIWNMKANMFRDDDATEADPMKPMLDRMIDMIVAGLSGSARNFYDTEFIFFDAVTSISGKLRPYIKASKPEKKAKIDEEMAKIDLAVGVYLPSNPDGVVIDIDRKSGRPLQSHAKAPFMATFKVQKQRIDLPTDSNVEISDETHLMKSTYDVWQSAIFKVGDDCRQDMLALQVMAMFRAVFMRIGLVLYLFPYRVTATAPGCGIIDVVPNATSRDEMGRAKINDLLAYFVDKYGGVDTVEFQKARINFVQSMAAYSVACYILQIKDRHNGNIMIDGEGHIVHVDFGFLFDIGPGGIKFEPNSFKLNHEMVALMGGRDSQGYKMFTELTIKAFLAIRPHADQICDDCYLMLGTALPSFKGEGTIKRLRDRFALHLNERGAAEYMMGVIRNAHENMRSNVYDGFQKMQNGIPY